MKLLFVCTGNTCRSCMAEAIAKHEALKTGFDADIISAGIYASSGDRASANAVKVMEEMGIDLTCHLSRPLNYQMLQDSDLVLAMTGMHKSSLLSSYPDMNAKIFTLMEYIGESGDIRDPFGGDIVVYRNTAVELKKAIDKLFLKLSES